jgi:hypothetical protein
MRGMPAVNPEIELVFLLNPKTGETQFSFESPIAGGMEGSELWWESGTSNYFLYQPDDWYDELLCKRRSSNNMISPLDKKRRLHFVAIVFGAPDIYDKSLLIISRSRISPDHGRGSGG